MFLVFQKLNLQKYHLYVEFEFKHRTLYLNCFTIVTGFFMRKTFSIVPFVVLKSFKDESIFLILLIYIYFKKLCILFLIIFFF